MKSRVSCGQWKYKNHTKRYRLCEMNRTKDFIKAYSFNKDKVDNKCILYKAPGDVLAADIYAHKNCMKKYVKKYLDSVGELLQTFNNVETEQAKAPKFRLQMMNYV